MATWISRTYEGATQSEALVRFVADAQAAERSGYRPAQQVWHEADGAHRLIVAFKRVSLAPRAPGGGRVPDEERIACFRRVLETEQLPPISLERVDRLPTGYTTSRSTSRGMPSRVRY